MSRITQLEKQMNEFRITPDLIGEALTKIVRAQGAKSFIIIPKKSVPFQFITLRDIIDLGDTGLKLVCFTSKVGARLTIEDRTFYTNDIKKWQRNPTPLPKGAMAGQPVTTM